MRCVFRVGKKYIGKYIWLKYVSREKENFSFLHERRPMEKQKNRNALLQFLGNCWTRGESSNGTNPPWEFATKFATKVGGIREVKEAERITHTTCSSRVGLNDRFGVF